MRFSVKAHHLPQRVATGAFILNSGIGKLRADEEAAAQLHGFAAGAYPFVNKLKPTDFTRLLAVGEITLGAPASPGEHGEMRSGSETASTPTSTVSDPHLSMIRQVYPQTPNGCEECLRLGTEWVHLRPCLTCGHVGCCDSSPLRHARAVGHPIVRSFEPGESWR